MAEMANMYAIVATRQQDWRRRRLKLRITEIRDMLSVDCGSVLLPIQERIQHPQRASPKDSDGAMKIGEVPDGYDGQQIFWGMFDAGRVMNVHSPKVGC
jgi:hypothetical protein